jgi:hypothetical protein
MVVDNYSDDTVKLAQQYATKYTLKPLEQFAQAYFGTRKAEGKYFLPSEVR